jgi:glutaredoxin-related protein
LSWGYSPEDIQIIQHAKRLEKRVIVIDADNIAREMDEIEPHVDHSKFPCRVFLDGRTLGGMTVKGSKTF